MEGTLKSFILLNLTNKKLILYLIHCIEFWKLNGFADLFICMNPTLENKEKTFNDKFSAMVITLKKVM